MLWLKPRPIRARSLTGGGLGPEKNRAFLGYVVTRRRQSHSALPGKRFEVSEATRMISRQLNSADPGFAKICSTALLSVFCSSIPKTVAPS
jgi:hypothetical protein